MMKLGHVFLRLCGLLLVLSGLCGSQIAQAQRQPNVTQRQPNVILIMADDVSWECFGCYGAEDYKTPNIDALAAKGVRFANCFSTPICTPSRVKLMTGQYNFRNYTHFGYLNPKDKTFAQMLKSAGYATAIAGKWQLNGLYHKAAGCDDNSRPFKAGFDEYCLWQVTTGKNDDKGGERFWSPPLEHNGKFLTKEDNHLQYGPDIMSDFVCDFIERNRDQPFFAYYPSVLVHDPFVPTPDSIGDRPRTAKSNKAPKSKPQQKENFVAMVGYLDKIVGKIVNKVKEVGQLENTIILFTADNGTNVRLKSRWKGQEIKGGKGGTTDMGTHVPLVAYWKGHTPVGAVLDDLIDFTDFYPTLAEAANVQLAVEEPSNDPIDGRSFLPRLQGQPGNPRDWVFWHYQPYWGRFPGTQFIRNEEFKLYRDGRYFNVPNDLTEQKSIALGQSTSEGELVRKNLRRVLDIAPLPPTTEAGKNVVDRVTRPDWRNIVNPND